MFQPFPYTLQTCTLLSEKMKPRGTYAYPFLLSPPFSPMPFLLLFILSLFNRTQREREIREEIERERRQRARERNYEFDREIHRERDQEVQFLEWVVGGLELTTPRSTLFRRFLGTETRRSSILSKAWISIF
jgi:heme exporter protein D